MQSSDTKGWKKLIQPGSFDMGFFVFVMALLTVGVIMLFSSSYVYASYSRDAGYDPYHYIKRQAIFAVLGVIFMLAVSRIRVEFLKKFAYIGMAICIALLVLVLLFPARIDGKEDFKRWLNIPGIPQFQPSELAKFGLTLFCARILSQRKKLRNKLRDHDLAIPICFVMIMVTCGFVIMENHLSCTILLLGLGCAMLVLGGVRTPWIVATLSVAVVGLMVFLLFHEALIPKLPIGEYAKNRLIAWLDKDSFATDIRWQTNQSLYAIGSGGLFGQGLGKSKQKHLYMPEPQNDFIFSIVCEELGFIGAVGILVLFGMLIWRGFVIAMNSEKRFTALLVMGVITQVGLQTILNILVVTDTIPNTGIGLPFFSYGGSSLLVLMGEMGIVLSASRESNIRKK